MGKPLYPGQAELRLFGVSDESNKLDRLRDDILEEESLPRSEVAVGSNAAAQWPNATANSSR